MENSKEEHIIKNLIYEESARKHLQSLGKEKQIKFPFLKFAAVILLLIMAIGGMYFFNQTNVDRHALASNAYNFPTINKSRSGETHIIDAYIEKINNKEFDQALNALSKENLSDKDLYYKAHIIFQKGEYKEVLTILEGRTWEDDYFAQGSRWLIFLSQFNLEYPKTTLLDSYNQLSEEYKSKSQSILKVIE